MQPHTPAAEPSTEAPASRRLWRAGTLSYTSGGLAVLFSWLLWGDFAWMLKERSAFPVVQIMLRKFQASDWLTGFFLLSLPAAIGLILVPVVSYRSDRHRGRLGRRIPYLLATTPVAALALAGIAFCPLLAEWLHGAMGWPAERYNLTVITLMGLSWTVFEFGTVIANAIFLGLLNDVVPREWLGRFFGLFRAVSLLTGMIFNFYLIGHVREHFMPILAGIAAIYGVGFLLMCLKVKEGDYPPPETMNPDQPKGFVSALRTYARECFTQPYYLLIFAALALAPLAFTPVNLYSIYAAEHFGLSMESYGKFIVATYACSLLLAYPLGWMADRLHALRMAIGSLLLYIAVMAVGWFWVDGAKSFGVVLLVHGVVSGCYFTGAAALGQMLFPKIKFAQFASAGAMLLSVCNIVFGPAMGRVLDWLDHDYRYTFGAGALIAVAALAVTVAVYRRFLALGGTKGYVAP
ncbi:MAG: hypothetical protein RIS54_282 [Verrucomicrobiota bacterium]